MLEFLARDITPISDERLSAITVPGGFSPPTSDVPVGIELESSLIRLTYGFEQATQHPRPPPSTPPL